MSLVVTMVILAMDHYLNQWSPACTLCTWYSTARMIPCCPCQPPHWLLCTASWRHEIYALRKLSLICQPSVVIEYLHSYIVAWLNSICMDMPHHRPQLVCIWGFIPGIRHNKSKHIWKAHFQCSGLSRLHKKKVKRVGFEDTKRLSVLRIVEPQQESVWGKIYKMNVSCFFKCLDLLKY